MIQDKKQLLLCLEYEKILYSKYMFQTKSRYFLSRLKREPIRMIHIFLRLSRKADFYNVRKQKFGNPFYKALYLYYITKKNYLGEKLGLEIETINTREGLMIYHYNNVINGGSIIGQNCHLHGNNCIGNDGKSNKCPIIGDNVILGVGAKVIGDIYIANNIIIAAGAIVVHSFEEEGITIGGIPAKKIK
ncbi:2,3,4,5-tetrahydropyridine-2,6-carboxylate N-succinyltransferase [Emticicia sp. BO119]|uniref:2,3,4,5-tetrahydropyridine-2,6-carboxylate N-succinyltransferase n=1 Tax=Emticicia sp. BO119 TaxID=2757768 RepID=UPI0015F06041|nr:2,3,4,5-tetrahydropyridine-2,6-carboxylate N-succinyltransferase [Emticicia sp. BO119]MBA4850522.1 2,3,4,5-tetrahydropyridine-2,6-carboxylate N-succinyltransferase [Emticicia sp. BO119]